MTRGFIFSFVLGLAMVGWLGGQPLHAQSVASATPAEADSLYQLQQWSDAADAYRMLVEADSAYGLGWYRLGSALYRLDRPEPSAAAFERAAALGFRPALTYWHLARVRLTQNQPDAALAHLDSSVAEGFKHVHLLDLPEFGPLQADARFKEVVSQAEANRYPCGHREAFQQLDFWIGTWDVYTNDQLVGTNRIYPILEHCVLYENWMSARGNEGKSFNYYNAERDEWRQVWVADDGGILEYTGTYHDGAMRLSGQTLEPDGRVTLQKLTLHPVAPDTVRQVFEASYDDGHTWTTTFTGVYVRRE